MARLERRYFPDWHPFQLFRVGGVVFTDVGRTWFTDGRNSGPDEGGPKDVGFGMRLAGLRFLPVAYPEPEDHQESSQLAVKKRGGATLKLKGAKVGQRDVRFDGADWPLWLVFFGYRV